MQHTWVISNRHKISIPFVECDSAMARLSYYRVYRPDCLKVVVNRQALPIFAPLESSATRSRLDCIKIRRGSSLYLLKSFRSASSFVSAALTSASTGGHSISSWLQFIKASPQQLNRKRVITWIVLGSLYALCILEWLKMFKYNISSRKLSELCTKVNAIMKS